MNAPERNPEGGSTWPCGERECGAGRGTSWDKGHKQAKAGHVVGEQCGVSQAEGEEPRWLARRAEMGYHSEALGLCVSVTKLPKVYQLSAVSRGLKGKAEETSEMLSYYNH